MARVTEKFLVQVDGDAPQFFDSAEEAVKFAGTRIYAGSDTRSQAVDALNAGRLVQWAYGFYEATIYPPGVEIR